MNALYFVWVPLLFPLLLLVAVHIGFRAPRIRETRSPKDFALPYHEVRIPTLNGKQLFAWHLPTSKEAATVIILHGWGGNAEMMLPLATPLHAAGYNILLFDARNHGLSDGDSFSSLPRFAEDVSQVTNWIKSSGQANTHVVLLGHSVGAGAVLFAAAQRSDIQAVISIAAFAHPAWMMRRYLARLHLPDLLTGAILRYVEWVIGHRFDEFAPMNTLCRIQCPVLLVHGTDDSTVPTTDAEAIRNRCGTTLSELILIQGASHDSVDKIEQHSHQLIDFLHRSSLPISEGSL